MVSAMTAAETPATTSAISLGLDLKRAQHLLRQRMDDHLREFGLNAGTWSVLHEMIRSPGASASELARNAFQTPQTVGGLIQRLTTLGLVERHQARGRVVENHLTERGREVYQSATAEVDALITAAVAGLTARDRDQLGTLLAGVVASLGGRPDLPATT
jgi:DNA-binding MarR family transcriptional regulator